MDRRDFFGQLAGGLVALASRLFSSALAAMTSKRQPAEDKRWRHWANFGKGPVLLDWELGDDAALNFWRVHRHRMGESKPAARAGRAFIDLQVRR